MPYKRAGSSSWYINVKGVRRSSGTDSYADAKALEDKLNHEAWLQDRMGVKPPRSWKQAVVKWLDEKAGKVSIQDDIERLKWLDQHLGTVSDIGRISRECVDGIMQLREGVHVSRPSSANCTANKYVALIAGILNAAERQWQWGNRAPRLRYYKVLKDKGRALTVEEWKRLETTLPKHFRLAATFSISTGLRAAKVFGLKWTDLKQDRSLSFNGTGNKIGNSIPLNATAQAVLKECRSMPIVHATNVFTYAGRPVKGYSKDTLRDALERAGIERIRFHDFRGTFISWLAQNGVPRDIRMRLAGHTVGDSHDRYVHLNVEHLRPYSQIIDTLLAQSGGQSYPKQLEKLG
jgi:site-specific recombinase XerD